MQRRQLTKPKRVSVPAVCIAWFVFCPQAPAEIAEEKIQFFRNKIEPVLRQECYQCHSPQAKEVKGEFLLHNRESLSKGGPSGKAIVPGKVGDSLLISALKHVDLEMPPKKRLSDTIVADFERWVEMGAPDPRDGEIGSIAAIEYDYSEGRKFWSFQPLKRPDPVEVQYRADWARTEIDRFILRKLAGKQLKPSPIAAGPVLIRRIYFDLVGLPPSPKDLDKFNENDLESACADLIDKLLESPHYGERWGRHWLDLARFGESHGYEADDDRPQAFQYRDAVIQSWNQDMPYDKFVQWQIAGDEYDPNNDLATRLTGFCGAGPTLTNEGGDRVKYEKLDDIVSATGEVFLGLSIGCARCHDHKFDPISAKDYYRFAGIFNSMKIEKNGLVSGSGRNPAQSYFLYRGDFRKKCNIDVGLLSVMLKADAAAGSWRIEPPQDAKTTYLRRSLAEWITNTETGAGSLLARVIVNRIWQHHFGSGIVRTPSDFGAQGDRPSHPELLDYLAEQLVEGGWKIKPLHRMIMNSAVYLQSSAVNRSRFGSDPENRLLARRRLRRLEAELVRDNLLAVSGCLNRQMYGASVKPWIPTDAIATGSTKKWPVNVKDGPATWRRSVYVYAKRSMLMPMLQAFDFPDCTKSCAVRNTTTVAPAALLLMNNAFVRDQARHFSERIIKEAGDQAADQVRAVYRAALARQPSGEEIQAGVTFLAVQSRAYAGVNGDIRQMPANAGQPKHRALALINYCQAVMGLNEFIYVE
ncbi:MAG: PSD1 and planctomycete cytochrome C domain-containing protein [Pirellulales bacterium]